MVTVGHQAPRHIHELLGTYLLPKLKESVPAYKVTRLTPPHTHTHTHIPTQPPTPTPHKKNPHSEMHTHRHAYTL